jgi:hypothetical protein
MKRVLLPIALFLGLTAHVGSPNVVFDGEAGPYAVRVVVRPPMVVPGRAEVIVEMAKSDTARVNIRPVFWRAGVAGAPSGDDAPRVAGSANVYAGQIWLMSRGSYSVYVTVTGARGSGTAIVPVTSFATGRLGLSKGLAAILVVLGGVLFVGLITIVRAASAEALLEPGDRMTDATRRRARIATVAATPILALIVFGGARWWGSVDGDYERTMYRPPAVDAKVERADGGAYLLDLRIHDTAAFHAIFAPVIPDHGKMMHLFVVSEGNHYFFGHFHPSQTDSLHFREVLAGIPPGEYNLFADVVLANGLSQTVTTSFDWPLDTTTAAPRDPDDATWKLADASVGDVTHPVAMGDGLSIVWTGASTPIVANEPADLRFEVRDAKGNVATLAPYLGMAAHAVVLKSDESVFVHLHPMGTVSTSAQQTFAARDRGDTTANGTPLLATDGMTTAMPMSMDGHLDFPYEFPKAGRYRMWVQVRAAPGARVLTGAFDLDVR